MKPWLVVVNRVSALDVAMSTFELIATAARSGTAVFVADVADLEVHPDGHVVALARRFEDKRTPERGLVALRTRTREAVPLSQVAVTLLRTNPNRAGGSWRHEIGLQALAHAADRGARVLNDPRTLLRARSKLYLHTLPEHTRPRTLVSRSAASIRRFIEEVGGRAVIKPLQGTHGRDVFLLDGTGAGNLAQIIDVVTREGFAMVQDFVPEAARGDVRLLLVDGEPLEVDGRVAAVRRVPQGQDFRSNVKVGGKPEPAELTPELAQLVADVGPCLRRDDLFLVGLDVIGTRIVEVNVFAPGGLGDAGRFAGVDFLEAVVARVAERVTRQG